MYILSSNKMKKFYKFQKFQSDDTQFTLNSFHFIFYSFFIKQNISILFMSYVFSTHFAFLFSSLSTSIKEYIFDFNPTNSVIIHKDIFACLFSIHNIIISLSCHEQVCLSGYVHDMINLL